MSKDDEALYAMLTHTLDYLRLANDELIIHRAYAGDKATVSDDLLAQVNRTANECANVVRRYRKAYME